MKQKRRSRRKKNWGLKLRKDKWSWPCCVHGSPDGQPIKGVIWQLGLYGHLSLRVRLIEVPIDVDSKFIALSTQIYLRWNHLPEVSGSALIGTPNSWCIDNIKILFLIFTYKYSSLYSITWLYPNKSTLSFTCFLFHVRKNEGGLEYSNPIPINVYYFGVWY